MPANDVTLYAIYRKVITITYIDTTTRTNSCTVYNNTSNCNITLYGVNGKSGYNVSGWRTDTQAAAATYGSSSTQTFSNSTTLYAIWSKTVHLYSYDGSTLVKDSVKVNGQTIDETTNYKLEITDNEFNIDFGKINPGQIFDISYQTEFDNSESQKFTNTATVSVNGEEKSDTAEYNYNKKSNYIQKKGAKIPEK